MDKKQVEEHIIHKYQSEEKMMILIYAQWCVNHDLNPIELYERAYPNQLKNDTLVEIIEQTVPKEEADAISNDIVLSVLQTFGNNDLAMVVQEEIEKQK